MISAKALANLKRFANGEGVRTASDAAALPEPAPAVFRPVLRPENRPVELTPAQRAAFEAARAEREEARRAEKAARRAEKRAAAKAARRAACPWLSEDAQGDPLVVYTIHERDGSIRRVGVSGEKPDADTAEKLALDSSRATHVTCGPVRVTRDEALSNYGERLAAADARAAANEAVMAHRAKAATRTVRGAGVVTQRAKNSRKGATYAKMARAQKL